MGKVDVSIETKVLSVRLPLPEAARVDARAAACGLGRSDYVRARLLSDQPIANASMSDMLAHVVEKRLPNSKLMRFGSRSGARIVVFSRQCATRGK